MQNTKENHTIKLPDHLVYLTEKGFKQADMAGVFLKSYLDESDIDISNATLWNSPFKRARQTAKTLNKSLGIKRCFEDPLLIEERFGLFSDEFIDILKEKFPHEFQAYDKYYQTEGKFYFPKPQGDSGLDVYVRAKLFTDTIFRDLYFDGIDTHFIVSHGAFIKAFVMSWLHETPEWYANTPPIDNCNIIEINRQKKQDKSLKLIYKG
jgi:broad specificity phosphatase PhoE